MIYKVSLSRKVFNICNYSFLGLLAFLCFYPFWYILMYSLSDPVEASAGVSIWFKELSLVNYMRVFNLKGIGNAVFISVLRTIIGTICTVSACSFLGYIFSKREMPCRTFLYRMLIITMYISGGLIPRYLMIKAYGLGNTFAVYIIPGIVSAYNVILVKTFVEQLPDSLEESAMMEGAGYFTIFRKIIFPLCGPIVATIAIFTAVGQWNTWMDNYLFVSKDNLQTLQYTLYNFLKESTELAKRLQINDPSVIDTMEEGTQLTPKSVRMTITLFTILPIFLFYPFMQKHFTKGIMIGAVKG